MLTYSDIADRVAAGDDDAAIAAYLPTTAAWWRPLTANEALRWLSKAGRMVAAKAAIANEQMPAELRGAIEATLIAVAKSDSTLDLRTGSDDRTLLLGCAQAGIFALADVEALIESTRLRPDPTVAEVAAVRQAEADRLAALQAEQQRVAAFAQLRETYVGKWFALDAAWQAAKDSPASTIEDAEAAMIAAWGG